MVLCPYLPQTFQNVSKHCPTPSDHPMRMDAPCRHMSPAYILPTMLPGLDLRRGADSAPGPPARAIRERSERSTSWARDCGRAALEVCRISPKSVKMYQNDPKCVMCEQCAFIRSFICIRANSCQFTPIHANSCQFICIHLPIHANSCVMHICASSSCVMSNSVPRVFSKKVWGRTFSPQRELTPSDWLASALPQCTKRLRRRKLMADVPISSHLISELDHSFR